MAPRSLGFQHSVAEEEHDKKKTETVAKIEARNSKGNMLNGWEVNREKVNASTSKTKKHDELDESSH